MFAIYLGLEFCKTTEAVGYTSVLSQVYLSGLYLREPNCFFCLVLESKGRQKWKPWTLR